MAMQALDGAVGRGCELREAKEGEAGQAEASAHLAEGEQQGTDDGADCDVELARWAVAVRDIGRDHRATEDENQEDDRPQKDRSGSSLSRRARLGFGYCSSLPTEAPRVLARPALPQRRRGAR
jgi:hypothetical protein